AVAREERGKQRLAIVCEDALGLLRRQRADVDDGAEARDRATFSDRVGVDANEAGQLVVRDLAQQAAGRSALRRLGLVFEREDFGPRGGAAARRRGRVPDDEQIAARAGEASACAFGGGADLEV